MTPKELVLEAVAAIFINFDPTAAEQLLAPDYIQHNPGVPTGAAPILGFIPGLKDSGIEVDIHRVISEGDMVVLHTTYNNAHLDRRAHRSEGNRGALNNHAGQDGGHGGEAEASRDRFKRLDRGKRQAVLRFLNSL